MGLKKKIAFQLGFFCLHLRWDSCIPVQRRW
jgi:hypothetical protein